MTCYFPTDVNGKSQGEEDLVLRVCLCDNMYDH